MGNSGKTAIRKIVIEFGSFPHLSAMVHFSCNLMCPGCIRWEKQGYVLWLNIIAEPQFPTVSLLDTVNLVFFFF